VILPASATGYQRNLNTGWLEHWSVSIQRQLGGRRAVEVAYVGSRGHDLIAARDINQPRPSPVSPNLRPNPAFDDITFIESRGTSDYNSLQVKFQQRFDRGVSLLSAYTFGKSTDDASGFFASAGDPNFPQDSLNPEAEKARSSFDLRHRFSLSFAWELPFGSVVSLLRDMELQGIVTFQSGAPFTVALLPEFDNSNTGRSTLGFGANDRPDLVRNASLADPSPDRWFDTGAFAIPQFGSFGNAGRNILDGPGRQNVNLGILKHIPLGRGEQRLQLRAEAFNLFNRANFNLPDAFVGSPTFWQADFLKEAFSTGGSLCFCYRIHLNRLSPGIERTADGHFLPSKLFRLLLIAQRISFLAVIENVGSPVRADAGENAFRVGRPHAHSRMIGSGTLVVGDGAGKRLLALGGQQRCGD
jgi:hypothetical protein